MKKVFWIAGLLLLCNQSFAQTKLEGLWEGSITIGGIYGQTGYKFVLLLEVYGKEVFGQASVYLSDSRVIRTDVKGQLYDDRSVYLEDVKFVPIEPKDPNPIFLRKYQFIFNKSIWNSSLDGYWQELTPKVMKPERKRGRIFLKKGKSDKP